MPRLSRHWAPALSLALHAGVLAAFAAQGAPAPAAPAPVPAPPPSAVPAQDAPPTAVPAVVASRAAAAPPLAVTPRPPQKPRRARPAAEPAAEPAPPVVQDESPPMPVAALAVPPPAVVPAESAAAPRGSTVEAPPMPYLQLLQARLERAKVYPAAAQRRGQQGVAHLRFRLDRAGHVLAWQVARSSGHALLDREVEVLLQRAAPLPPLPPEMAQAELEVEVPIQFTLR